jgi:hypothetical protein
MSKAMHCRPSTVYGLSGVRAYWFDNAVVKWGTAFDNALQEATHDAKNAQQAQRKQNTVLRRWLGAQPGMYRDPAKR